MTSMYLFFVLAMLALSTAYIGRVIRGPTIFDRVVGLNGMGTKAPVVMIFIALIYQRVEMVVDIILALFLLNLVTTLLIAKYVREKGGIQT